MLSRTTVTFARPFHLPSFGEQLPAGDYDIETELSAPPDHRDPGRWKASVMIGLHPRSTHPGLARNLTVSLADLDGALAKDKLTGKDLSTFLLDALLEDPMVRLVMKADGVSEAQLRHLYTAAAEAPQPPARHSANATTDGAREASAREEPVALDTRRNAGDLMAADIRRHSLREFEADQHELRKRQEELEAQLLAEPARSWHEAGARAQYLIRRYAETSEAQDARKQKLVERALGDLARLMEEES